VEVDCNPDLVWIDTTIEITTGLKTELSDEYLVEAENPHNTLGE
jgi:hypothetical protein